MSQEKEEFRSRLLTAAKRAVEMRDACRNEESAKLFLVLPFIGLLGYDDRNPKEVVPEHGADFSEKYKNRVDFAIFRDGEPVIAVECKAVGGKLKDDRGQLKSYFNAVKTIKLGILTDGFIYEFFVDSISPNLMDDDAFLRVDLATIAESGLSATALDSLFELTKPAFKPETIGETARYKFAYHTLKRYLDQNTSNPGEDFTRALLLQNDIKHVKKNTLEIYQNTIRAIFTELFNERVMARLEIPTALPKEPVAVAETAPPPADPKAVVTSEKELFVYDYARRRLSFLLKEEQYFQAIQKIGFRDYQGKMVVFYDRERKGRLFDFIEQADDSMRFIFAEDMGEIITTAIGDIDDKLTAIFRLRVGG